MADPSSREPFRETCPTTKKKALVISQNQRQLYFAHQSSSVNNNFDPVNSSVQSCSK